LIALWLEAELHFAGGRHGLEEFHLVFDGFARSALGDRRTALANLVVASPRVVRADTGRRATVSELYVWVGLALRIPRLPLLEVVHVRKQRVRRRGDGMEARHPVAGWLHCNDDDEDDDDGRYRDKDNFQHRFFGHRVLFDGTWA
jgi:hypothetical protein